MSGDMWVCRFMFSISLTPEAAQRQADLTANLDILTENGEEYLSEKIYLYLDNEQVDELSIGADLKGRAVTDIAISGSGEGYHYDLIDLDDPVGLGDLNAERRSNVDMEKKKQWFSTNKEALLIDRSSRICVKGTRFGIDDFYQQRECAGFQVLAK